MTVENETAAPDFLISFSIMIEGSNKINGAFMPDWEPRPPVVMITTRGHF